VATMTAGFALEAVDLNKSFGALKVTDDVTLRLRPGSRTALIGPNGAGKTTLVGLLSGTIRSDAGSISMFGRDVTHDSLALRVKRGLVRTFQVSSLFINLTVLENVFLALSEHEGASSDLWRPAWGRRALIERADAILERLRLADYRRQQVASVPYGVQRLLEIAIALALEPKVLLLDEPAAGIPANEMSVLLDAVDSLPDDIAILMIEHDMHVVRRFAAEVNVRVHGRLLMTGPPAEVMASPEVRSVYLGSAGHSRFTGEVPRD
jgi:branched-chain amino acid transport system ATP-binding protein